MGASSRAPRWMDVSAEVLATPDAHAAHRRLVRALSDELEAFFVVRTSPGPDGLPVARYGTDLSAPIRSWPPVLDRADEHPLLAHLLRARPSQPVTLADAVRAGSPMPARMRELIEAVGLTVHQLALPMPGRPGEIFALIAGSAFGPAALEAAQFLHPVVAGLDRHIALLARLEGPGPVPAPATTTGGATARPDAVTTGPGDAGGRAARTAPGASRPGVASPALTPRELIVLHGIAGGSTAEGIAARLAISPRTVHKHQENLYRKLGAVDRLSAVLEAQRAGLLPAGPPGPMAPAASHPRPRGAKTLSAIS